MNESRGEWNDIGMKQHNDMFYDWYVYKMNNGMKLFIIIFIFILINYL